MIYQGGSQPEVMQAGVSGKADILALWAPNIYTMKEKYQFEVFCSAKDFGSGIDNMLVVNADFASSKPDRVKKFLAVMLRATNWIKANPQKAQEIFISASKDPLHNSGEAVAVGSGWAARRLFAANSTAIGKKNNAADRPSPAEHRPQGVTQRVSKTEGLDVSQLTAKSDYELRPIFSLDEQLKALGQSADGINDSAVGRSFYVINVFLNEGKSGSRRVKPNSFIDITFLNELDKDKKMSKIARSK